MYIGMLIQLHFTSVIELQPGCILIKLYSCCVISFVSRADGALSYADASQGMHHDGFCDVWHDLSTHKSVFMKSVLCTCSVAVATASIQ